MKEIQYLEGDATRPQASGKLLVAHICNDQGGWGKGFVMALSARWKEPELAYREWADQGQWEGEPFGLGGVQTVDIPGHDLGVVNMVAQHGIKTSHGVPPIRYGALETCLHKLQKVARQRQASIHMPRIGCGLAGGSWDRVEPLVRKLLFDVPVFVYDLARSKVQDLSISEPTGEGCG